MSAASSQAHAAGRATKFPVVCDAEIDTQILDSVLEHPDLVLVSNKIDLSELLTSKDRPIEGKFKSPFTDADSNDNDPMMSFKVATAAKEGISAKAFIVIDNQTLKDGGKTCRVSTHDDDRDEENYHARVAFRCELASAVAALNFLALSPDGQEHQAARALRNEAAIAGGVWSKDAAARQHEHAIVPRIKAEEYPQSKEWDVESGCNSAEDSRPYIAVFRVADIDLETVNSFVKEAYAQRPETDPTIAPYTVAFVTSLQHPFHSGPAQPPFDTVPALPPLIRGATPLECDILVRHLFAPQEKSELNYNRFIIMDELIEQTKTVLLACNCEFEGTEFQLVRCDFGEALNAVTAPENTSLTMNAMGTEAATGRDGVRRWELSPVY